MVSVEVAYGIALAAVVAYGLILWLLYRAGRIGADRSLSLLGPALMLKTRKGLSLLDRIGRFRRLWTLLGDLGVVLAGIAMALIIGVLALDAVVALEIPASAAPSPSEALAIPGLNPIIPIGYGIVALVVGIVLHELMHGVIARSQGIGVKSVGILFCVIPIGAFVEPDETAMTQARRRPRSRVGAAGILANFGLTVLFFFLLAGLVGGSVAPNANGVGIGYVVPGFPADNISLAAGDIVTSVNGTPVHTTNDLFYALANTTAGETIPISYYSSSGGHLVTTQVTLASTRSYTHQSLDANRGFLGISPTFLTPAQLQHELTDPLQSPYGPLAGVTYWVVLPLAGLEPVQGATAGFFHLTGPFAGLGVTGFWLLANVLFWLAWMNLLLGLSNALPLVPLDGGLLFRDFVGWVASRVKRGWDAARIEMFSGRAVLVSSVLVVFLLIWQFVAPHL
jgi:membrane-associated protease RseP (regulator of RpoE activity)